MYNLKGFIPHASFAINTPGQNAVIGEISVKSLSYSKEIGFYTEPTLVSLALITMISARDDVKIEVPNDLRLRTLTIGQFIYDNTISHPGQVYPDVLLNSLIQQFAAQANTFACGDIVNDGNYWMPQWVSWIDVTMGEPNAIKIWFVDSNFQTHYDNYEITVIPPFDNLDDFFKTGTEVKAALEAITVPMTIERAQAARVDNLETVIRADLFNYYDPLNPANIVPSIWGELIYGAAGDNIDSVKDALVNYILANSTHTRTEWTEILPDLFRRTEFIIVPLWDQFAIPNRTSTVGIYSPQVNLTNGLVTLKEYTTSYANDAHINEHASVMGNPYKSLALLSVGSPDNRGNLYELVDVFPDIIAVSTGSVDFNRMEQATQLWLLSLAQMLITAETMGPYTDIPTGYSRLTRDGKLYIVKNVDNISYLVGAKSNFPEPTDP